MSPFQKDGIPHLLQLCHFIHVLLVAIKDIAVYNGSRHFKEVYRGYWQSNNVCIR